MHTCSSHTAQVWGSHPWEGLGAQVQVVQILSLLRRRNGGLEWREPSSRLLKNNLEPQPPKSGSLWS